MEDEKQNHQQKTEDGIQYEDNEKDINDLKLERLSQKAISQNTDSSIQKHTKKYPKNTKWWIQEFRKDQDDWKEYRDA